MTQPAETPPPPQKDEFHTGAAMIFGGFLTAAGLGIVALLLSDIEWTWKYWGTSDGVFDRSAIFRNFGLTILGLLALGLGAWRSWTAHLQAQSSLRQAGYAAQQVDNAIEQRRIAVRGQQVERYQKGALMLESSESVVRIAGVFALQELAISDPAETNLLVQALLVRFICSELVTQPPKLLGIASPVASALDASFNAFQRLRYTNAKYEVIDDFSPWTPDFSGVWFLRSNINAANFTHSNFSAAQIKKAIFEDCDFQSSFFSRSIIKDSRFDRCDFSKVDFANADLDGSIFNEINISGCRFKEVKNVAPDTFVKAWYWKDRPPTNPPENATFHAYDPGENGLDRELYEETERFFFGAGHRPNISLRLD